MTVLRFGACASAALLGWAAFAAAARADTIEEKAAVCSSCHGEKGVPTDKAIPIIWGQQEGYLYLQLRDFKKGVRKNEVMNGIAESLEKDDMKELAAYFAAKPWPNLNQASASDADVREAKTVNSAVGCSACHLDQFQGTGTVPRLSGQNHDYLAKTLAEFRSGERANNPGMTSLAQATPEPGLKAMEDYLAGM
jgi:cytochrome c553